MGVHEDVDARFAELREAIAEARSMPMSASVMLNRSELLDLVERLDAAVTGALASAAGVESDRDALVAQGRDEAAEIVRQAELEREKLVSDSDVYRVAADRAEELAADAERESAALRAETEEFIETSLANFEHTLEKTLETVRRGLARLNGGHAVGAGEIDETPLPDHLQYQPGYQPRH